MSLTHNAEADFAGSELARMFVADPALCYSAGGLPTGLSASATYEPSSSRWPKADGVVSLLETGALGTRDIAVEYKRVQEGTHGLLTANCGALLPRQLMRSQLRPTRASLPNPHRPYGRHLTAAIFMAARKASPDAPRLSAKRITPWP